MANSGYEKLEVWNKASDYAVTVIDTVENLPSKRKHFRLLEQIEASASSIAMNIAEGKGRLSKKEFAHYLCIVRGSLYETMTLLEIFKRKGWIEEEKFSSLKSGGTEIAAMLNGLINSIVGSWWSVAGSLRLHQSVDTPTSHEPRATSYELPTTSPSHELPATSYQLQL